MNFLGSRSAEFTSMAINEHECEFMVKSKKCEANTMECHGPVCSFDGSPRPEYYYLSTFERTGVSCRIESKLIVAKDENEKLFSTECRAKDHSCLLKKSIIICKDEIIRKCEFDLLTTVGNLSWVSENILYQEERQWAFQLIDTRIVCKDNFPTGIRVFSTTEGIFQR